MPDAYGAVQAYQRTVILPMPATDEVTLYAIASYDAITDLQTLVDRVRVGTTTIDEAGVNQLQLTPTQSDGSTVSLSDVYAGSGTLLTDDVVVDDNIITARGPAIAMKFGLAIIEKLCGKETADKVASGALCK